MADPAAVKERVLLVNDEPVLLFIEAEKKRHTAPFQQSPQQSDYSAHWEANTSPAPLAQSGPGGRLARFLQRLLPEQTCREALPRLAGWLDLRRRSRFLKALSFGNARHYQPTPPRRETKS